MHVAPEAAINRKRQTGHSFGEWGARTTQGSCMYSQTKAQSRSAVSIGDPRKRDGITRGLRDARNSLGTNARTRGN